MAWALVSRGLTLRRNTFAMRSGALMPVDEPLELKPGRGPASKLLYSLFWVILLNGLFIIYVWWGKNEDVGLILFMGVLSGLIGLVPSIFAIYYFLALLNPRPFLTIRPGAARLGANIDLAWTFSGSTGRCSSFRMWLVGTEEVLSRRDRNTHPKRIVFEKIPILHTDDPNDMQDGEVKFTVPESAMHTFVSPNGKIQWSIRVCAEVWARPDIKLEFPFTVLPLDAPCPDAP